MARFRNDVFAFSLPPALLQLRTCSGATREIEAVELRFMVAEFFSRGLRMRGARGGGRGGKKRERSDSASLLRPPTFLQSSLELSPSFVPLLKKSMQSSSLRAAPAAAASARTFVRTAAAPRPLRRAVVVPGLQGGFFIFSLGWLASVDPFGKKLYQFKTFLCFKKLPTASARRASSSASAARRASVVVRAAGGEEGKKGTKRRTICLFCFFFSSDVCSSFSTSSPSQQQQQQSASPGSSAASSPRSCGSTLPRESSETSSGSGEARAARCPRLLLLPPLPATPTESSS